MTEKKIQRRVAYDARNAQANKNEFSQIICDKFISQTVYRQANTILWYLHCRSEVKTLDSVIKQLSQPKKIVIPYCTKDQNNQNKLGLWWLEDIAELVAGTWDILEPPKNRWNELGKEISPKELDLIMVPGVSFDRKGGRLGNGAGYYDRLLQQVRPETLLTAVCFESQLCDKVTMEPHDIYMDIVLTESNTYHRRDSGL